MEEETVEPNNGLQDRLSCVLHTEKDGTCYELTAREHLRSRGQ